MTVPAGLFIRHWPLPAAHAAGRPARGMVLLVHGLGEHIGRYERLAAQLNAWGFAVTGFDQYGHGQSDGARGAMRSDTSLVDDVLAMLAHARSQMSAGTPLLLLGHSMGGLVASLCVARHPGLVDGLILSSPALDPGLSAVQKLLLATLPRIAPGLRVGNGLKPAYLSHDAAEVAEYLQDPLVHDRVSAGLARFIADQGQVVRAQAARWQVTTLLLYAGEDHLVNPDGARAFAQLAPAAVVSATCFAGLYHELFNELQPARDEVMEVLQGWLDQHFGNPRP